MSALPREFAKADAHVPIARVLDRLCREMAVLADDVDGLQVALSPIVTAADRPRHDTLRDMQSLDVLAQKLRGIADFLAALGLALPDQWRVDSSAASRAVLLADLADRLSGALLGVVPDVESGELELW